jgi:hypothetical protein
VEVISDPERRRIADRWAGTRVVNAEPKAGEALTALSGREGAEANTASARCTGLWSIPN